MTTNRIYAKNLSQHQLADKLVMASNLFEAAGEWERADQLREAASRLKRCERHSAPVNVSALVD